MRSNIRVLMAGVALAAATGVAGCDMGYHPPPEPVASTAPTISYRYSAEADLPRVRSEANTYCSSFSMHASLANVVDNDDGTRTARFNCDRDVAAFAPGPAAPPPAVVVAPPVTRPPLVSYGYSTPAQYAAAADNASAYCQSYGARARQVNVVDDPGGSRTVTFSCDQPM